MRHFRVEYSNTEFFFRSEGDLLGTLLTDSTVYEEIGEEKEKRKWNDKIDVALACDIAEHGLAAFKYDDDTLTLLRKVIEQARKWVAGEGAFDEVKAAAHKASTHTLLHRSANRRLPEYAAAYAVYSIAPKRRDLNVECFSAADSAAYAVLCAFGEAGKPVEEEKAWQTKRLLQYLDGEA